MVGLALCVCKMSLDAQTLFERFLMRVFHKVAGCIDISEPGRRQAEPQCALQMRMSLLTAQGTNETCCGAVKKRD